MLKYYNIINQYMGDISDEEYEKLVSYEFSEDSELYRLVDDDAILYRPENEVVISDITGMDLYNYSQTLNDYLDMIQDGGYSIECCGLSISMWECVWELKQVIKRYEERIYEADDIDKEINIILAEFALKILEKKVKAFRKQIKNKEFSWT